MTHRPLLALVSAWIGPALWLCLTSCDGSSKQHERPTGSGDAARSPLVAGDALDRLDARTPVPLLPMMAEHQKRNMRDHLVAVQDVTGALAIGDFPAVQRAAQRLGSSQQMTRTCEHMGAHAPGFTEVALSFHQTADRIARAAERQDRDGVLSALNRTLAACTSCHSTYKQKVVDDATWSRLSAPPH